MLLPAELEQEPEQTTVVGDMDLFIEQLESGAILREWTELAVKAKLMLASEAFR